MDHTNGTNGTAPTLSATLAEQLTAKPAPVQATPAPRKARKPAPAIDPATDEVQAEAQAHKRGEVMVAITRESLAITSVSLPQSRMDTLRAGMAEVQTVCLVAERTATTPQQAKQGGSVYRTALCNLLTDAGCTLHLPRKP